MRAAYIEATGPPENIRVGELPDPTPGPGQALVRVGAAAVNPIDTYIRGGAVAWELPRPFVVGCDLAGEVVAVGPGVDRFRPGDRVWGSNQGLLGRQGTFAELAAVDHQWLYPTPASVTDEQAAATALVGVTAYLGLVEEAQLAAGETIVVSGGSGAVGSTVIQMARALGARVIATTSGAEKADYCRALGADHVLDYRRDNVVEGVRALAPEGAQVWWETSRAPDFDLAVGALGRRGRIVVMAGRTARPEFPLGPFYLNCSRLLGFVMFLASPESQARGAERINQWLVDGALATRIDRVAALDDTAELHRLQEQNTIDAAGVVRGKLVVKM